MSEITVSGKMKVKTFYAAFINAYPYLYPSLRYPEGKAVDAESSIANARSKYTTEGYSPTGEADISVRGNLKLETFEKRFMERFSIQCIFHFKRNGKWVVTGPKYKSLTLNEANNKIQTEGGDLIIL